MIKLKYYSHDQALEARVADIVDATGMADQIAIIDDQTITFSSDAPRMDFDFANAGRGSMYIYSKAQFDAQGMEGYGWTGKFRHRSTRRRGAISTPGVRPSSGISAANDPRSWRHRGHHRLRATFTAGPERRRARGPDLV